MTVGPDGRTIKTPDPSFSRHARSALSRRRVCADKSISKKCERCSAGAEGRGGYEHVVRSLSQFNRNPQHLAARDRKLAKTTFGDEK